MDTALTGTASKWISDKPLWPGNLMHNMGIYWPIPDYSDDYYKMLAVNAEKYTTDASRATWAYGDKRMLYCAASSGWDAYAMAMRYPNHVLDGSKRFVLDNDKPFPTVQRIGKVLAPEIAQSDMFARNYRRNQTAIEFAAQQAAFRKSYLIGPADQEGAHRSLFKIHSMMRGAEYEDAIWEMHLWGPRLLHDIDGGIYYGDHAWSRNACPEKEIALAVQYGLSLPLMIRRGNSYDVTDIQGRPVSIVDQAWEDARHVVDVVERGFRTEPAAALLLVRFMYDHQYRKRTGQIEYDRVHPVVAAHYNDSAEMEKMQLLQDLMLPYLANFCDWPTLHGILNRDPALKDFWQEYAVSAKGNLPKIDFLERTILSYLPRGGFDHPDLRYKMEKRADLPTTLIGFSMANKAIRPLGIHEHGFDCKWDPKMFDDRDFSKLGATGNPNHTPDPNHLTFEQAAAIRMLDAFRGGGRPPLDGSRTLIYLDEPADSLRAAVYRHKNNIRDPREMSAIFDPLSRGSDTLQEFVLGEAQDDFLDRVRELTIPLKGRAPYEEWRENHDIGNIIPLSDFKASAKGYEGRREALDTEIYKGIAADGPMKISGPAIEAVVKRYIDIEADGLVLPAGQLNKDSSYRYILEGLLVALGQVQRPHSGGKYQFEFFMDFDYYKPPNQRRAPIKMNFADLFVYVGMQVKAALEEKNPPKIAGAYLTMARLCDIYEKIIDPGRCNIKREQDRVSGEHKEHEIIPFNQADPNLIAFSMYDMNPGLPESYFEENENRKLSHDYQDFFGSAEFQAFMDNKMDYAAYMGDPAGKAKLCKMIWGYMRALEFPNAPVRGVLLNRGIWCVNKFDLRGLDNTNEEYSKAWEHYQNVSVRKRANIFRAGQVHVHGPAVAAR